MARVIARVMPASADVPAIVVLAVAVVVVAVVVIVVLQVVGAVGVVVDAVVGVATDGLLGLTAILGRCGVYRSLPAGFLLGGARRGLVGLLLLLLFAKQEALAAAGGVFVKVGEVVIAASGRQQLERR